MPGIIDQVSYRVLKGVDLVKMDFALVGAPWTNCVPPPRRRLTVMIGEGPFPHMPNPFPFDDVAVHLHTNITCVSLI